MPVGGAVEHVAVAIVGAGPSGSLLAARLAGAGIEVLVLERSPEWRWRAGGVFASPAAPAALARAGLPEAAIADVTRSIPAMRVETRSGTSLRLTYGAELGGPAAVGFDRSGLDPLLVDLAASAGAEVRRGCLVTAVEIDSGRLRFRPADGTAAEVRADIVVGADGTRSVVARAAGVQRPSRLDPRVGLSYHLPDPGGIVDRDARMRILPDGYVGIAPVPGGRVNVGIVLGPSWRTRLAGQGARAVADEIVRAIPPTSDDPGHWRLEEPLDRIEGAWPLGHRVARRAGPGWLLVGDAAGFLDPFSGEGLHRGFVSSRLAAAAIVADRAGRDEALSAYDRAMQRRFLTKDAVSWLVQAFLARPAAFEYAARRIAVRSAVRATIGLVMGDLVPASRALDPRFLADLLRP
jgi:flavin-dependent dehydrogenase